ncbi:hypothetical protein G8C93_03050 [Cellulosimicrobium cellulans]|uniref:hypothetical protein n=1 Tax=Cellulosimicrobium cellulans TaxID=1710 RepID=UPI0018839259|nr:hypothetical protein [Cellulosimicrobium cellulans]MBE9924869.1 hypothetical protein [Cellulosimicrobium cellulans]
MVERKRPSGTSPISLTPRVEPIATPAVPAPAVQQPAEPAAPAAPTDQPDNRPEARPAAMTPRRAPIQRQRAAEPEPSVQAAVGTAMISRTFRFREALIRRAETAVLRTAGLDGGHVSMTALLNTALERELARLEDELNAGEPFPANRGEFRRGRPIGS